MNKVVLILLSVAVFSCNKEENTHSTSYDLQAGKSVFLDYNECLEIINKDYQLCLTAISDSRCPSGLRCVWGGDAVVEFYLSSNGSSKPFVLHTHSNYQRDTIINGLKIDLLSVSPYPNSTKQIDPEDYSVELMLSSNEK